MENLSGKIFEKNIILVRYSHKVIGKKAKISISKNDPILFKHLT